MTVQFTPPTKPPKVIRADWATYIPDRKPKFKIHDNRGQAFSAISYTNRDAILYHFENNQWTEVVNWVANNRPTKCEDCGADLMSDPTSRHRYFRGEHKWIETKHSIRRATVCRPCYRGEPPTIDLSGEAS